MFHLNEIKLFNNILNDQKRYIYKKKLIKGDKVRLITAPVDEYKYLQSKIKYFFDSREVFKISDISYAWEKGKSREMCAKKFLQEKYNIRHIDIYNFFPSIKDKHLEGLFIYNSKIPELLNILNIDLRSLIGFLTVRYKNERVLPQGFTTSPLLANAVRFPIDEAIKQVALEHNLTAAVFGDNILLGGRYVPKEAKNEIKAVLKTYGFNVNYKKDKLLYYWDQQKILGLVVNEKLSIPKEYKTQVINEILNADHIDHHLIGKISQFRLCDNKRNYNYLVNLVRRVHGKEAFIGI